MTDTAALRTPADDTPVDSNGYILVRREPPVATITINRPAQRNAISLDMWVELTKLLRDLDSDRDSPLRRDSWRWRRSLLGRRGHRRLRAAPQRLHQRARVQRRRGRPAGDRGGDRHAGHIDDPRVCRRRRLRARRRHRSPHRRRGQPPGHTGGPPGHHHWTPRNVWVGEPGGQGQRPVHPAVGTAAGRRRGPAHRPGESGGFRWNGWKRSPTSWPPISLPWLLCPTPSTRRP